MVWGHYPLFYLLVSPFCQFLDLTVLNGTAYLSLDGAERFAELNREGLHVFSIEFVREVGQQDIACCGTVGLGDFDVFCDAVIEDVEDVVVVMGDCSDDGEGDVKVCIRAFDFFGNRASVHTTQCSEGHCNAQAGTGEAVCAGVVEVSVEFLYLLLFSCEVVVESLLLDDGEDEPDFADLGKMLVEILYLSSEVVKDFLQRTVCVVAR